MLTFDFVQPGEFDDPWYDVLNNSGENGGKLYYHYKSKCWAFAWYGRSGLTSDSLDTISAKLKQLNGVK